MLQTTLSARTVFGRIQGPDDLHDALVRAARQSDVRNGSVRAIGALEDAAVAVFDSETGEHDGSRPLPGGSEVLSLEGRFVHKSTEPPALYVVLGYRGQVVGGKLVSARVLSLDVTFECWDESTATVAASPAPMPRVALGTPPAQTPESIASTAPVAQRTLADAARVLESMPTRGEHDDAANAVEPEPGDYLDHPSFGIVEVESEGDSGRIRIKLAAGSYRDIMLDVFDVTPREPRNGKPFFQLRPRRR